MGRIPTLIEHPSRNGAIAGVNPKSLHEMPYYLLTNRPNNTVVIPANQSSPMQVMSVSGEGPAQLTSFAHEKTNNVKVFLQIQDGQSIRGLMNGAVHIDTIMGTARQPYYLAEALYLDELRSLQVAFTDISTLGSSVRIAAFAKRLLTPQVDPGLVRAKQRIKSRQYLSAPHFYTFDGGANIVAGAAVLGIGAAGTFTITVGQDHHFEIFKLSAVSTGRYNINIVDQSTGESIISGPQDVNYEIGDEILFGTGNFPFTLHEPRMIQVGQRLLVTITNRHVAQNTIFLTLGGRAVTLRMWR